MVNKKRTRGNNLDLATEASYKTSRRHRRRREMELFGANWRVVALIVLEEQICVTWVSLS